MICFYSSRDANANLQKSSNAQSLELYNVQLRNFDNWVLEELREMPHEHQAFFPTAICLYSSSDTQFLSETGVNVAIDILSPITTQNGGSYLTIWLSHHWKEDIPPPFRYVSELLQDPSRAAEFLVTEIKFTDFALRCAKIAFGVMRP
jgi:hypothetical protein